MQQQATNVAALSQLLRAGIEAGEFRRDMEVETQARILMATLHGLMVQWHRQPGRLDQVTQIANKVRPVAFVTTLQPRIIAIVATTVSV